MSKVGGSDSKNTLYCSFCGKSQHEVRKLIAGPTVFVCDECVELCMDIIRVEHKSSLVKSRDGIPTPKEIRKVLDDYVIGRPSAFCRCLLKRSLSHKVKAAVQVFVLDAFLIAGNFASCLASASRSASFRSDASKRASPSIDGPFHRFATEYKFGGILRSCGHLIGI